MRELDRESPSDTTPCARLAIVGRGRLGSAFAAAFDAQGLEVMGPFGRGADGAGAGAVLLCVPDGEIAVAASLIAQGRPVGHCSGAMGLEVLGPHEAFSLHPLISVTSHRLDFAGVGAAIDGSTPRSLQLAASLAEALGMQAIRVDAEDRAAYHAAASIASNFLITLEAAAERLAASAGIERSLLVPLVRASVENWATLGPERALTGPVARGDETTVALQRSAIQNRAEELLPLFDTLVEATRRLAQKREAPARPALLQSKTLRTTAELRSALAEPRRRGRRIGLVPTMGALHDGHLALIARAREECDEVVVSVFVNPTQFNEVADLERYPRDETRDARLAFEAGVDFLFAPPTSEVYPRGFSTTVSVGALTDRLEGAARGSGHFDGVSTIVTKLLNIVSPDVAYFGQKDAQQALVIRRLVRDLDMPVQITVCPTVREPDGLAMSSRNAHLSPDERTRAPALYRALQATEQALAAGIRDPATVKARAIDELTSSQLEPEYLELVALDTLAPVGQIEGEVLAVVAARVGGTRLIDNHLLSAETSVNGGGDVQSPHRPLRTERD